jgi:hypothetical protein
MKYRYIKTELDKTKKGLFLKILSILVFAVFGYLLGGITLATILFFTWTVVLFSNKP